MAIKYLIASCDVVKQLSRNKLFQQQHCGMGRTTQITPFQRSESSAPTFQLNTVLLIFSVVIAGLVWRRQRKSCRGGGFGPSFYRRSGIFFTRVLHVKLPFPFFFLCKRGKTKNQTHWTSERNAPFFKFGKIFVTISWKVGSRLGEKK